MANGSNMAEDNCTVVQLGYNFNEEAQMYIMAGPALFIIACMSLLSRRTSNNRRPAIPYPVALLEEHDHRLAYVAAFCVTAYEMLDLLLGSLAFSWSGLVPASCKSIVKILLCMWIGLIYYPILAAIHSQHWFGFLLGAIYTAIMAVFSLPLMENGCEESLTSTVIDWFTAVPPLLAYAYLFLTFMYKIATMCLKISLFSRHTSQEFTVQFSELPHVQHVRALLRYGYKSTESPKYRINLMTKAARYFWYRSRPDFRYSLSLLVGTSLSLVTTYIIGLRFLNWITREMHHWRVEARLDVLGQDNIDQITLIQLLRFLLFNSDDNESATDIAQDQLKELFYWITLVETCLCFSLILAFLSLVISMLATLRNYRIQMLCIYKGIYKGLPRYADDSPRSIVVSACKYIGFQVGYATWGFSIMFVLLSLVTTAVVGLCSIIFRYVFEFVVEFLLVDVLPVFVFVVLLSIVQNFAVHFFFIQKDQFGKKRILAINNRRAFFNFHYFLVFLNAALGLLSCLMRIFKAVLIGAWILPRLDWSPMPRNFERLDKGFVSYVNLLKLENSLNNPVMLLFVHYLVISSRQPSLTYRLSTVALSVDFSQSERKYDQRIVRRWYMLISLHNNLTLRFHRKHYLANALTGTRAALPHNSSSASSFSDKQSTIIKF